MTPVRHRSYARCALSADSGFGCAVIPLGKRTGRQTSRLLPSQACHRALYHDTAFSALDTWPSASTYRGGGTSQFGLQAAPSLHLQKLSSLLSTCPPAACLLGSRISEAETATPGSFRKSICNTQDRSLALSVLQKIGTVTARSSSHRLISRLSVLAHPL